MQIITICIVNLTNGIIFAPSINHGTKLRQNFDNANYFQSKT